MSVDNPFLEFSLPARPMIDVGLLQQRFDERARELHPDAGGDTEGFARLKVAREVLHQPARRIVALLECLGAARPPMVGTPPPEVSQVVFDAAAAAAALRKDAAGGPPESSVARAVFLNTLHTRLANARNALGHVQSATMEAEGLLQDCDQRWEDLSIDQRVVILRELHPRLAFLLRARETLEAAINEACMIAS